MLGQGPRLGWEPWFARCAERWKGSGSAGGVRLWHIVAKTTRRQTGRHRGERVYLGTKKVTEQGSHLAGVALQDRESWLGTGL